MSDNTPIEFEYTQDILFKRIGRLGMDNEQYQLRLRAFVTEISNLKARVAELEKENAELKLSNDDSKSKSTDGE